MSKRWVFAAFVLLALLAALPVVAQIPLQTITPDNADGLVQVGRIPQPSRWQLLDMAWSPDGTRLAFSEHSGVRSYDITSAGLRAGLIYGDVATRCVTWSPDGKLIAACNALDGTVFIWNAETGEQVATLTSGQHGSEKIAFSPDGKLLAVYHGYTNRNGVYLWGVSINGALQPFSPANAYRVQRLADLITDQAPSDFGFSPDGASFFTANRDGMLRIWDMPNGELKTTKEMDNLDAGQYSPDGRLLAVASDDIVRLLDAQTLEEITAFPPVEIITWIHEITFTPDSSLLSITGGAGIVIADVAAGQLVTELTGHPRTIWRAAFNPNGTLLASLGWDDGIRFWGRGSDLALLPTFTPVPSPTFTPAPTATPFVLAVGVRAQVNSTAGDRLNMRAGAGRGFDIVAKLDDGMFVTVLEGPQTADDLTWWKVRTDEGLEGWVVDFVDDEQTLIPVPMP